MLSAMADSATSPQISGHITWRHSIKKWCKIVCLQFIYLFTCFWLYAYDHKIYNITSHVQNVCCQHARMLWVVHATLSINECVDEGATENARPGKCRSWKTTDQIAGLKNAGPNNFTSCWVCIISLNIHHRWRHNTSDTVCCLSSFLGRKVHCGVHTQILGPSLTRRTGFLDYPSLRYIHTYIHKSYLKWPNVKKLLNHCRRRLLGLRRGKNAEINMSLGGYRKQGAWEQRWCCAVDCSRVGWRKPGRHDRPWSPAALIGQSAELTTSAAHYVVSSRSNVFQWPAGFHSSLCT